MVDFIDEHRAQHGVEPICKVIPIAPSTYYQTKHLEREPSKRCARFHHDEALKPEVLRVWHENFRCYGAYKIWKQLALEGIRAARCTIERLMRELNIKGVRRGRAIKTTIPDEHANRPQDLVNRQFEADHPNQLWVADITYGVPRI